MKKKYFVVLGYVLILWAASWLIFGESGVIETNFKQKEILRLRAEIQLSTQKIEDMSRQYKYLRELAAPDQNFLAGVDRKARDIVVYKFPSAGSRPPSKLEERRAVTHALIMGGAFILIGIISITALTISARPYSEDSR